MQRSVSASRRRSRRRVIGLSAGATIHVLAGLVLLPVAWQDVRARPHASGAADPVVLIQLVHLRRLADSASAASQSQPRDAPQPKPVSLPQQAPTRFEVADVEQGQPEPSAPTPVEDDDPLYRVPFVDAVAQADARLRVGLGCEHVDLQQLPKATLDLCAAARQRDARPRGPLS